MSRFRLWYGPLFRPLGIERLRPFLPIRRCGRSRLRLGLSHRLDRRRLGQRVRHRNILYSYSLVTIGKTSGSRSTFTIKRPSSIERLESATIPAQGQLQLRRVTGKRAQQDSSKRKMSRFGVQVLAISSECLHGIGSGTDVSYIDANASVFVEPGYPFIYGKMIGNSEVIVMTACKPQLRRRAIALAGRSDFFERRLISYFQP